MKKIGYSIFSVLIFMQASAVAEEKFSFNAKDIRSINLKHGEGTVVLKATTAAESSVMLKIVDSNCEFNRQIEMKDGKLFVEVKEKKKLFHFKPCRIDLDIAVPGMIPLEADIGASQVHLEHMDGKLSLNVGTGSVSGTTASTDLTLNLGTGHVALTWNKAPTHGKAFLKVGIGTVVMTYPMGTVLRANCEKGIGRFNNEVTTSQDARYIVECSLGMGDITLKTEH